MKPLTLLTAIAKDEGAYLHEWIFHHLEIGFDHIRIYINRTNDNSREILEQIQVHMPNRITVIEADYLANQPCSLLSKLIDPNFEKGNPLQSRAFADAFIYSKDHGYDYVAFFDIDEYLYLANWSVSNFLDQFHSQMPHMLKFKWFSVAIEREKFGQTFTSSMHGQKTTQCKFMLSTNSSNIVFGSTHHVFMEDDHTAWISGEYPVQPSTNQRDIRSWYDQAYIVHRSFRSRPELFALLIRGEPGGVAQNEFDGYKLSRLRPPSRRDSIEFTEEIVAKYSLGLTRFITIANIEDSLKKARILVLQRAGVAKRRYLDMPRRFELLSECLSKYGLPRYELKVRETKDS